MRIVTGKYKGRHFSPPKGFKARPTTDFAKESLFNILQNNFDFENLSVLDLFAGSGNISFEFLSRGAALVHTVERDSLSVKYIKTVSETLKAENHSVLKNDVFKYLSRCINKYDLIFADPPYNFDKYTELYENIFNSNILKQGAFVIIEHSKATDFSDKEYFSELRKYGSVNFSFFIYD